MYRECIGFHQQYVGNHAKLKPTYEKINDIWYPVKSEDFSPNSTVFDYFPRHELVATYQLSYFLCEENINRKKPTDDAFIVVRETHDFLYKILDYSFISIDQARNKIFFDGICLEEEKGDIPRVFYIYLKNNIIIKLNFTFNMEAERWYADYPIGQSESNNLIESYFFEDGLNNINIFNFRNNKYLLANCFSNFKPLGCLDWSADYAFYEKVMIYLSKISKENIGDFHFPTVSQVKSVTSFLQSNEIFPDTSDGYLNTQQYLERIIENTTNTNFIIKSYKTLYEKLLQTSDYEKFIAEQVSDVVEKRSDLILKNKEEDAKRQHQVLLDQLQKQISEKENELDTLSSLCEELKHDQSVLDSTVSDVKLLISDFINQAGQLSLSERKVIEKLNQVINEKELLEGKSLLPSMLPPWSYIESKEEVQEISETEAADIFRNLALTYGYENRNVIVFDRLIRTGNFVLLIDQYAHLFIEQYSRLICGGRVSNIVLDASYIGIDDLWRNPATNLSTGFAYTWNNALNNPDDYYVIHLTGITEVSYLSFFQQLKQVITSSLRPKNLLFVGSNHIDMSTLESRQQQIVKGISKLLVPLKFQNLNINLTSALDSLLIKNFSQIMYVQDDKGFIQIMNMPIKTYAQFLQYERLYSLSGLPEHLFIQKDGELICDENLDALKMIEGL